MKKYCYFDGLLVIYPLISAHYSSFTTSVKNSNHSSPPLELTKHIQATISTGQTTHNKKYKRNIADFLGIFCLLLLARFYGTEKDRQIPSCKLDSAVDTKVQNKGSL